MSRELAHAYTIAWWRCPNNVVNDILGELQNGFRIDRRINNNLFVLTQCIEISKIKNRPLYVDYLDITGAYDNINQEIL